MKNDLAMLTNAVNGMLSTDDFEEKKAWSTIYNARYNAIVSQIAVFEAESKEKGEPEPIPEAPAEPPVAEPESVPEVPAEGTTFTE